MTLAEIIERLEEATGPDRELDAGLGRALGWYQPTLDGTFIWNDARGHHQSAYPTPFTTSLDAALALVERVLPGASRNILLAAIHSDNVKADDRFLRTLPIGVCLALCRALQAQETPHD